MIQSSYEIEKMVSFRREEIKKEVEFQRYLQNSSASYLICGLGLSLIITMKSLFRKER